MSVIAIINPISGAGPGDAVAGRVELLREAAARRGVRVETHLTARAGHAREIAGAAVAAGATLVIAWGGDGTINEAGGALVRTPVVLSVIPAGSGNGLAATLALPRDPHAAVAAAFDGVERTIDVGMIGERHFFNIAGVGFDAHIARLFNERARGKRGGWPYISIGVREGCRYVASEYQVSLDDDVRRVRALLIAFANGREYGLGARIAPHARLDDGVLDAIVVEDRSVPARFLGASYLAIAAPDRAPGVIVKQIRTARIEADAAIPFHIDGEPALGGRVVDVEILPGALTVRVPRRPSVSG